MNLSDLVESVGITDEEFEQLIYRIRLETAEKIMNAEKHYQAKAGEKSDAFSWRDLARKKILATFGNESIGTTLIRLSYVEYVTVDPDLKQIIHDLTSRIATMHVFHPEKYQELLKEAQAVDERWKIKVDDLGYFTVKE